MVEGILVVNLDPPYVGFVHKENNPVGEKNKRLRGALKSCSLNEIRQMLLELGAISSLQQWPPPECTIRVSGTYSASLLARLGLEAASNVRLYA